MQLQIKPILQWTTVLLLTNNTQCQIANSDVIMWNTKLVHAIANQYYINEQHCCLYSKQHSMPNCQWWCDHVKDKVTNPGSHWFPHRSIKLALWDLECSLQSVDQSLRIWIFFHLGAIPPNHLHVTWIDMEKYERKKMVVLFTMAQVYTQSSKPKINI